MNDRKFVWTTKCQQVFDNLKTHAHDARSNKTIPNQVWPTKICIRSYSDPIRFQWRLTSMHIYFKDVLFYWKKLQDLWSRAASHHSSTWGMEALYPRIAPYNHCLSDHKNLMYFWRARKLNWWQAWWSLYLSEFDTKLVHIARTKMVQSDALSRWPDFIPEEDTDNEDLIMVLETLFMNLINMELQEQILNCKRLDSDTMKALKTLLEEEPTTIQNQLPDWSVEQVGERQVLYYWGKNYVPKDEELWWDIAKMFHDHQTAEHPGELDTYNSIRPHYWWPELRTYFKNYVQGCGTCQQFKINQQLAKPLFLPTEGASTTTRPFANCSMDFITDLPLVKGHNSILVIVDQGLTKGMILIPCLKTITAKQTAQLLLENLYKWFKLSDKIISDWGSQFASKSFVELLKLLGIKSSLSTAYHP